jgi:hypothetical protein
MKAERDRPLVEELPFRANIQSNLQHPEKISEHYL